jgi:hypothetical protein
VTIDHRARAIELDERAGGSNDAAKSQALATRALVHRTPLSRSSTWTSRAPATSSSGF